MLRYFELKEGTSNKFWEISCDQRAGTVTVRFGRTGGTGQTQTKTFPSAAAAGEHVRRMVAEKTGRGYQEIAPSSGRTTTAVADAPAEEAAFLTPTIHPKLAKELQDAQRAGKTELSVRAESLDVVRAVAQITSLKKLRLSDSPLTTLPADIGQLTALTSLHLEQSRLESFPPEIGRLTKLEVLYAYGNRLGSLPDEFGGLEKLRSVSLWDNRLSTLPPSIGSLACLEAFDLHGNQLESVPVEIGRLASLKELELNENALASLPDALQGLGALARLDLSENRFAEFPLPATRISNLRILSLQKNRIAEIPAEIGRLKDLRELRLAGNRIRRLPPELFTLRNLGVLDLRENQISEIPREIGALTGLKELLLDGNPIENVPEEVIRLGKDAIFRHLGITAAPTVPRPHPEDDPAAVARRYKERLEKFRRQVRDRLHDAKMLDRLLAFLTGTSDEMPPVRPDKDHYSFEPIMEVFAPLDQWTFIERRALAYMAQGAWCFQKWNNFSKKDYDKGFHEQFYAWLREQIRDERADTFGRAVEELKRQGITDEDQIVKHACTELNAVLQTADRTPTSAGQYLLLRFPAKMDVVLAAVHGLRAENDVLDLFIRHRGDAIDAYAPRILQREPDREGTLHAQYAVLDSLCATRPEAYERNVLEWAGKATCVPCLAELGRVLKDRFGDEHRARALDLSRNALGYISENRNKKDRYTFPWTGAKRFDDGTPQFIDWILARFGRDALDMVRTYVSDTKVLDLDVIEVVARRLGQDGIDIVAEALEMDIEDDEVADHYRRTFRILQGLDYSRYHDRVWTIATSAFPSVRGAAAAALGRLGDSVVRRAAKLLEEKGSDARSGGALVLASLNTPEAKRVMRGHVDAEKDDDVRDILVRALCAGEARVDRSEILRRVDSARSRGKLAKPVKPWLAEKALPPLKWTDGGKLDADTVRYLFHRQTRLSDIGPEPEVAPLYAHIDRKSSGDFALEVLRRLLKEGGVYAKNRFALSVVGLLGDDQVVEPLRRIAFDSNSENAVETIGLVGSDAALRALDAVLRRFRTKYRNVADVARAMMQQIADRRGVSAMELADSVIPNLGFQGIARTIKVGGKPLTILLGAGLSFSYRDASGNARKSLPSKATAELKKEIKELAAEIRALGRRQAESLEQYMVIRRRWTPERLQAYLRGNPVVWMLASRLVWGRYEGDRLATTFTVDADGWAVGPVGSDGAPADLPKGASLGLVHPLDLDEAAHRTWTKYQRDRGITPPFAQLDRPLSAAPEGKREKTMTFRFEGREIDADTFKYRADRLGWIRGSVVDCGFVSSYRKQFPADGIEAIVRVDNLPVRSGEDMDDEARLRELCFVKLGVVAFGSYVYDEPRDETDSRLIPVGQVPRLVYSEAVGDLTKITRKDEDDSEAE